VLKAGFKLYRFESQDEADNAELQDTPLTIPVRMITQTVGRSGDDTPSWLPLLRSHRGDPDRRGGAGPRFLTVNHRPFT
jgi:hypothetical protein